MQPATREEARTRQDSSGGFSPGAGPGTKPGVILAMQPDYGGGWGASHKAFWCNCVRPGVDYRLLQMRCPSSFDGGNILLASAMTMLEEKTIEKDYGLPVTHIAVLHNDVVPVEYWLSDLLDEAVRTGADLLSAVIPIKDLNGLTSTAIDSEDDPFEVERRLTMREVYSDAMPETFDNNDCGYPHRRLLVNTGCFVLDITKPWFRTLNPDGTMRVTFTSPDRVKRNRYGKWEAQHAPSDWHISRDVASLGGKVMATRKIKLLHMGEMPYSNAQVWGDMAYDTALEHNFGAVPIDGKRRFDTPGAEAARQKWIADNYDRKFKTKEKENTDVKQTA